VNSIYVKPPVGVQLNRSHPLAKGLIGCWLFNEQTGNRILDLSGYGRDLTVYHSGAWVPGGLRYRGAYRSASPALGTNPYTLFTIARKDGAQTSYRNTFSVGPYTSNQSVWIGQYTTSYNVGGGVFGCNKDSGVSWSVGETYAICLTHRGDKYIHLYVDGIYRANKLCSSMNITTGYININGWYDVTSYERNGTIFVAYLYDRDLTDDEVLRLSCEPYAMFEQYINPEIFYISAGGMTYQATASDGMQIGEALARKATFPVSIADGLSAGDTPSKIATLLSQAADGAMLSDISSVIATLYVTLSDGLTAADSSAPTVTFRSHSIDGITLGETLTVAVLFIALSQDGALLGDTAAWKAAIEALATDGLIGGDSVLTLLTALATAVDGVTLSESLTRQLTSIVEVIDGMTLGDTGTLHATFRVQTTDGAAFSDSISRIVTFAALASDGFKLSDIAAHLLATGEVSITFITKKAEITFLVSAPGVTFTTKKPEMTFH